MEFDDAFKIKTYELLELCYDELGIFCILTLRLNTKNYYYVLGNVRIEKNIQKL